MPLNQQPFMFSQFNMQTPPQFNIPFNVNNQFNQTGQFAPNQFNNNPPQFPGGFGNQFSNNGSNMQFGSQGMYLSSQQNFPNVNIVKKDKN